MSRRDSRPQARAGPPADFDWGILIDMAGKVGKVAGRVDEISERLQRVEESSQQNISRVEEKVDTLIKDNSAQHSATDQKLTALGARLDRLEEKVDTPSPPKGGPSEGRKHDALADVDKAMDFGAKWGAKMPALIKLIGTGLAAILAWAATVWASKGGGNTTP